MEAKNYRGGVDSRKVMGVIFLIIFSLMFIFSCMKAVLPIGNIIVGTFGVVTFPLLLLLILFCVAKILGLSYTRNKKTTIYAWIILISLLFTIHSIATFKQLNLIVSFSSLKTYLAMSYDKITLIGSFGSIFCGLLSMMLGSMGVIIVFVILATLFIGLLVDYNFYGKYESKNVRKIRDRRVRNKVNNSDKNITNDNTPEYSFSEINYTSNDVVDEIVATENETIYNTENIVKYTESDVIGEVTDSQNVGYESYTNYEQSQETQTRNEFSSGFYSQNPLPDIYSSDPYAGARDFMSATYGTTNVSAENTSTQEAPLPSFGCEPEDEFSNELSALSSSNINLSNNIDSTTSSFGTNSYDDDISKILDFDEDEDLKGVELDISMNFDVSTNKIVERQNFTNPKPIASDNVFGGSSFGQNLTNTNAFAGDSLSNKPAYQNPQPQPVPVKPYVEKPVPAPQTNSVPQSVTIPHKPVSQNPYGFNMAMPGIKYNPPPLNLLKTPKPDTGDYTEEQNRKSSQLESVLAAFNIPAKVKNIVRGPKITRYELAVPLGVSVKKIPTYENDIAAALAAKTITIKAPIPGSPYVGIELENDTFTSVYERELLESAEFLNSKDPLPIAIGKDISGEIIVKSMAKMVHLLIAGSTGSGKSVFIHNIVLSLIYKYSPDDLRLIMIDPKKVEFNRYNGLPHLLTPEVVMGAEKAINALKWCVKEMDRRYDIMNKAGYNNIEPYNKSDLVKAGQFEHMPYIVIIVDELAEIMLANKKESEVCIQRITQLARACGMYLILATQRPSVDIISGVIKNNIPSRIAFSLQSSIDSKTILNAVGAEKLLGQGDMIFAPTGTSSTPRLQAAYASDDEIKNIIDYVIKYNQANFDEMVEKSFNAEQPMNDEVGGMSGDSGGAKETVDGYFKKAVKIVMLNGGASTSYLQRRLAIGYSRAARIIDQMEDKGYIAPSTGSKLRKVLITPEQFREDFGEEYDSLND